MSETLLSTQEFEDILTAENELFCPDPAGIKKGDSFLYWAKVGGEQQLSNVRVTRGPYTKGKTAQYVDVFGYGIRKAVNVKKLLRLKEQN